MADYCEKSMMCGIGISLTGLTLMSIAIFISGPDGDRYEMALALTGITLITVGLLPFLRLSWCRKCKTCCHRDDKEANDTFGSYSEQLHSQDNSVRYLRDRSRSFPVSQDRAQPSDIHDSNGVIPVSSATLELPLPVGTQVQETNFSLMEQPTLQVTQRSHSDTNRIPIPSAGGSLEFLSTDLDYMFADLGCDGENSGALFPMLKRESPFPPSYHEVMEHVTGPVENLSIYGENSGTFLLTPKRESPPPPSYQEVMEGGYVELPQTYQRSSTGGTI